MLPFTGPFGAIPIPSISSPFYSGVVRFRQQSFRPRSRSVCVWHRSRAHFLFVRVRPPSFPSPLSFLFHCRWLREPFHLPSLLSTQSHALVVAVYHNGAGHMYGDAPRSRQGLLAKLYDSAVNALRVLVAGNDASDDEPRNATWFGAPAFNALRNLFAGTNSTDTEARDLTTRPETTAVEPEPVATKLRRLDDVASTLCGCLTERDEAQTSLGHAECVIRLTAETFKNKKIAISFNGGKDAVVMLELILRSQGLDWVRNCCAFVLLDKEDEFGELVEFRKAYFAKRLPGCVLHEIESPDGMKQGLARALERFEFDAVFMGTRKDDPSGRHQLVPWRTTTPGWPPMLRVCPILSWTFADVWDYIRENNIPFCKLYGEGYTSLGSSAKSSPNTCLQRPDGTYAPAWTLAQQEAERAGRLDDKARDRALEK